MPPHALPIYDKTPIKTGSPANRMRLPDQRPTQTKNPRGLPKSLKILTCGSLLIDLAATVQENNSLLPLIEQNRFEWSGKYTIDEETSRKFAEALVKHPITPNPGGSALMKVPPKRPVMV